MHAFGVDRPVLEKLNRTKAAVEYPGTGTYKAALEVFHQLHCLVSYYLGVRKLATRPTLLLLQ